MAACFRSPPPPSLDSGQDSRRVGQTTQTVADSDRRPRQSPSRTDDPDSRRLGQTTQTVADSDRRPRQPPTRTDDPDSRRVSVRLGRCRGPRGGGSGQSESATRIGDSPSRQQSEPCASLGPIRCPARPSPLTGAAARAKDAAPLFRRFSSPPQPAPRGPMTSGGREKRWTTHGRASGPLSASSPAASSHGRGMMKGYGHDKQL